jgi:hypothetical protein
VVLLGLEKELAAWIASFPDEAFDRDSAERNVCAWFSSLAGSQVLFDDGRFEEAIGRLSAVGDPDDESPETFAASNPAFAAIAGGQGRAVFQRVRRVLRQRCHGKVALAAVSDVPVGIEKAVGHWRQALELAAWLGNTPDILGEVRDIIVGRVHVLRGQEGRGRLDALNDAVNLLQDALDAGWDGPDEALRQALVDSLLDRGVHMSNEYDLEKEARQDALRALGMAPASLRAMLVLCTANLHYARELYVKNRRDLARVLLKETEEQLSDCERLFPGNADLAEVSLTARAVRDQLAGEADTLEGALTRLRAVVQDTKGEKADSRLAQAMVLEAQAQFARAVDLYWALVSENPGDAGLRGKLALCYQMWLSQLGEEGNDAERRRVAQQAVERCPDSAALSEVFGTIIPDVEI